MTADPPPVLAPAFAAPHRVHSDRGGVPALTTGEGAPPDGTSESLSAPEFADEPARRTPIGLGERLGFEGRGRRAWRRLLGLLDGDAKAEARWAETTDRLFRAGLHHLR